MTEEQNIRAHHTNKCPYRDSNPYVCMYVCLQILQGRFEFEPPPMNQLR
jgi:hypothetical protein